MADTPRTLAALLMLLADNTVGAITPQNLRDLAVSVMPGTYTAGNFVGLDANGDLVDSGYSHASFGGGTPSLASVLASGHDASGGDITSVHALTFTLGGSITFADGSVQTTAATGGGGSTPSLDEVLAVGASSSTMIQAPLGNGSTVTVNASSEFLADSYGTSVVWNSRQLVSPYGNVALDWTNYQLLDYSGFLSAHWAYRKLYDSTGTQILDWNGPGIILPAYTLATLPSATSGALIVVSDANGGVGALAFGSGISWIDAGTRLPVS